MHKYTISVKLNLIIPFNDTICNKANSIEEIIIDIILPKYILPSIYTSPLNTISSTICAYINTTKTKYHMLILMYFDF